MSTAARSHLYGDDDVVVSGLSGRLPESASIAEFAELLFAGVDLVTDDDRRWTPGLYGLPKRSGKLKDLSHFDATFFSVHPKQAHIMDPQQRILLELTHEVIVDAGLSPAELRGSRTGVYVGACGSETQEMWKGDINNTSGYRLTGCARGMFSNRLSYAFDLKGPSYTIDNSCSSSMTALVQAADAIRAGQCDAAIVATSNLCLKLTNALDFHGLGMLSPEGRCAAFDASASGYVRSEAAVALLLQRRRHARRLYCTVRGARINNDGYKAEGLTYPCGVMQADLAKETFEETHIRPQDIVYVEAHGTGTKVGDPEEVNAIAALYCKDRETPLLLGSVKSNMGHSEPASGLCSVAKVIVAMERGVIPANLHFKNPNPNIPALRDGRIKVVDTNTPWQGGLVAVNSFGFGGANAHVILESNDGARPALASHSAPRLVLASGRTDAAVSRLLRLAAEHPRDAELHALLDAVHARPIAGHPRRGYAVLDPARGTPPVMEVLESEGEPRPVWFVFSGMGAQSPGVARALLRLPAFAASVARSAAALEPLGVDVRYLVTEAPDSAFDDVVNSFVSIAAVQVALVDVLRELGVHPDGYIGCSFGEIGCAYADGAFTAEQVMLCAYWRGRSILDAKCPPGAMAVVGVPWKQISDRCEPDIECVCIYLPDYIVISGPTASVEKVMAELTAEGVFARRVNSSGVAFHGKYIAGAAPQLRARLLQVVPDPKPRSARWLSTSIPQDQWDEDLAKLSDAAYHVNNLLQPVRFAAVLALLPARALVVEVAPHALLQAILKRGLPGAAHAPLLRRGAPDALTHLLKAVGQAFAAGAQPQVSRLYPAVPWPVSRGTPSIASHVEWDHSEKWTVVDSKKNFSTVENIFEYDLGKPQDAFLAGHDMDGRILFPAAGFLTLVWRAVANMNNLNMEDAAVVLENVVFRRATIISRDVPLRFFVKLLSGTGEFEISEGGVVAVTGIARLTDDPSAERVSVIEPDEDAGQEDLLPLDSDDIYKQFRLRDMNYTGVFRGIKSSDARGTCGLLDWKDNWISFIDTMIQFGCIDLPKHLLYLPTRLQRVVIDPATQRIVTAKLGIKDSAIPVKCSHRANLIVAGGVELRGITKSLAPRRMNTQPPPTLEKYVFLSMDDASFSTVDTECSRRNAISAVLQLALENCWVTKLKVAEFAMQRPANSLLLPLAVQLLEAEPRIYVDATLVADVNESQYTAAMDQLGIKVSNQISVGSDLNGDWHIVVCADVLSRRDAGVLGALAAAASAGFVLLDEPPRALREPAARALLATAGLTLVSRACSSSREYLLLRGDITLPATKVTVEVREDDDYDWVEKLKVAIKRAENEDIRVYVWSRAPDSGILGLGMCLRLESGGDRLRFYHLPGAKDAFDPAAPAYSAQVQRDLAFNVLRAGVWGTFRHLLLDDATDPRLQVEHAFVNTLFRGDLSSLRWIESDLRHEAAAAAPAAAAAAPAAAVAPAAAPRRARSDLCRVFCAALNFRDIMLATGKLPPDALPENLAGQECVLGLEFSGISSTGKRVMGMVAAKGLATAVLADESFMWEVPPHWSLEEAATVPVAYATAYYALAVRGRMRRGDSVLVHAGAGGVGQAAITIALHYGCTVFATVGTPDKRAFLRERFPQLPDANIGNSRDCSFEQLVLHRTRGRGVDLVLNSLAGDLLQASLRCLATRGRFLEIGKLDLSANSALGMAVLLKNTTVHGILLDDLLGEVDDDFERAEVVRHLTEGIVTGAVRPLPTTVFADNQLEQAFRYMATGKHIGKVLIRVREEGARDEAAPARLLQAAVPRTYMHPAKSYVLVGGLGGLGLELARWLAARGARTLIFNSRSGVRTGYQALCIRRLRSSGVHVLVSTLDATTPGGARALLQHAAAHAPVGGIFNLAGVVLGSYLEKHTREDFVSVTKPKINATRALDAASRALCPALEHFVTYSSVSSGRGSPGLSAYGFANSAMDRICELRRAAGLPALSVQWGAIADVGMALNNESGVEEVGGTSLLRVATSLERLGVMMALPHEVTSLMLVIKRRAQEKPTESPVLAVANILGIKNPSKVSSTATLTELGMDSLMSTEIQVTLKRRYDVFLNEAQTRALTFDKLRGMGGGGDAAQAQQGGDAAQAQQGGDAAQAQQGRSEVVQA